MKRRGLLTKLGLGILAAPSVAKAVIDKPEEPEFNRGQQDLLNKGMNEVFNAWSDSVGYALEDSVIGPDGQRYVVVATSNSPVNVTITSSCAE